MAYPLPSSILKTTQPRSLGGLRCIVAVAGEDLRQLEKIILNADHRSMVHKDETINEVLRILYLHAGVKWPR